MKNLGMIIFFSIVIVIYGLLNYYIIRRGLSVMEPDSSFRSYWIWGVIILASAFVIGRFLERTMINPLTITMIWIGSFWLGIMIYLFLQIAVIDIVRGLNHIIGFLPAFITSNPAKTKMILAIAVASITFLTALIGHINTWMPVTRKLDIDVHKTGGDLNELHIVAFSDVHLGTIFEKRHLRDIVNKVNALDPDIVLIPGDIIDEDIAPVINTNVGEILKEMKARFGIYAVTGNHEYIGGINKAKQYLHDHNIQLLNDTAVLIENSFYLVGREDISISQFTQQKRKELSAIIEDVDKSKPMILLDHQPYKLDQAEKNGIDLQLSGHTHHGQLWPFNFITKAVYELSHGYKQKGTTHYYVSCGIGGWGPPMRTNSRPEIVSIKMHFK